MLCRNPNEQTVREVSILGAQVSTVATDLNVVGETLPSAGPRMPSPRRAEPWVTPAEIQRRDGVAATLPKPGGYAGRVA